MPNDLNAARLERLRGDLAALRARTAAEFGVSLAASTPAAANGRRPDTDAQPEHDGDPDGALSSNRAPSSNSAVPAAQRTRTTVLSPPARPAVKRPRRAPRPPRRPVFRQRARPPSTRAAVPRPITVRRRPAYLVGPRWPRWGPASGIVALVVLVPAVAQLAFRLLQAMTDTTTLLGADPTRSDYLDTAAGVAGGGLTLAIAVAALAVVRGRVGYLAGAVGIVAFFCLLPFVAYTATAGIVSAPVPPLQEMIQPPGWEYQEQLLAAFWLSVVALVAAVLDLVYRSVVAVQQSLSR